MAEGGLQSVSRAFAVLDAVAADGGESGVTSIAVRTGLADSTVHRLLGTLVELGCLRRLPTRRYVLAPRLVRLGAAAAQGIGARAVPLLRRLVGALGESANLAVLSGDQAEYVAQAPSAHAMRLFTEVGRAVDLHSTGVGKAMLSALPEETARAIIARTGLPPRTEHTVTDADELLGQLSAARAAGYCLDEEEQELGVRCVAVPVPVSDGVVFAVSVSGPIQRMPDELVERAIPLLRDAAAQIVTLVAE